MPSLRPLIGTLIVARSLSALRCILSARIDLTGLVQQHNVLMLGAAAAFTVNASAAVSAAAAAPQHVRGTIVSYKANTLVVDTAKGRVSVRVTPKTRIAGILPGSSEDIKTGTFIGTANAPVGGTARALEVVVFPDSMRGTGEGDYAWDLPSAGKPSAMTNGTVAAPRMSSMTNATVSHIETGATRTVTVNYKGGTKRIAIPPNAPIVRVASGTPALLTNGAHVFMVAGSQSGALTALFVAAGEKGTVPPM